MKTHSTSILQLLIPHHIYSYVDISALACIGPCIAYDIRNVYVLFENGHFLRFAVTWLSLAGFAFTLCTVVYFAADMWKCFWTSIFPATSTSGSSWTSLFLHLCYIHNWIKDSWNLCMLHCFSNYIVFFCTYSDAVHNDYSAEHLKKQQMLLHCEDCCGVSRVKETWKVCDCLLCGQL